MEGRWCLIEKNQPILAEPRSEENRMKSKSFLIFFLLALVGVVLGSGCVTTIPMYPVIGGSGTQILSTRQVLAGQPSLGMTEREGLEWAREQRQLENDRARNSLARQREAQRSLDNYRRDQAYRQIQKDRADAEKMRRQRESLREIRNLWQDVQRERNRNR